MIGSELQKKYNLNIQTCVSAQAHVHPCAQTQDRSDNTKRRKSEESRGPAHVMSFKTHNNPFLSFLSCQKGTSGVRY